MTSSLVGSEMCIRDRVRTLWLQNKVKQKKISVHAVAGERNVADIGTKGLSAERLKQLSEAMGLVLLGKGARPKEAADSLMKVPSLKKR
eukprot:9840051-Prorocentrum_lima.AAC.1